MQSLYLSRASLGYIAQLILAVIIFIYFFWLFFRYRKTEQGNQILCLSLFFLVAILFIFILFLDVSFLPKRRLYIILLEYPLLGFAIVFLLQFAYRFPSFAPNMKTESLIVLGVSLFYTIVELLNSVSRLVLLNKGICEAHSLQTSFLLIAIVLWIPGVFFRQAMNSDKRSLIWIKKILMPQGTGANGARNFALISLLFIFMAVVNLLGGLLLINNGLLSFTLSVGLLVTMALFTIIYLDNIPEIFSLVIRLTGYSLSILLVVLGIIGWTASNKYMDLYQPKITDFQTLHFTPNKINGYKVEIIPYRFNKIVGERLDDIFQGTNHMHNLAFVFPFFQEKYSDVFITSSGYLYFGGNGNISNLQINMGNFPGIFPLLMELESTLSGGVYMYQDLNHAIITWNNMESRYGPSDTYTFQVILYKDGGFDITYSGIPTRPYYDTDTPPSTAPWLRGVTSGRNNQTELIPDFSQLDQLGQNGATQDFYMNFRYFVHIFSVPLFWLIFGGSSLILLLFPLTIKSSIIFPLNCLLEKIKQIENGNYYLQTGNYHNDEIGVLTTSVNAMSTKISQFVNYLEKAVEERTREIYNANLLLQDEINNREQIQARLIQHQGFVSAFEEREKIKRNLHDGLGQAIGSINIFAQAAHTFLLNDGKAEALSNLEKVIQESKKVQLNIRESILGLSASFTLGEGFIEAIGLLAGEFYKNTDIKVKISVPQDSSPLVFPPLIEEQVLRIIQEALSNIRKHSKAHNIEIILSLDVKKIHLLISDDGLGFDQVRKNDDQHLHFGTKMMIERAEQIGGTLEIRSSPGGGTKVICTIPRPDNATQINVQKNSIYDMRLLLVDDSPLFLEGLKNLFQAHGLHVVGLAYDGIEAQEKAQKLHPDIIFMDIKMPYCSGVDATKIIHESMPDIKIIILTVVEDDDDIYQAIRNGASGYLLKNLDVNELISLIEGVMRGETPLTPTIATRLLAEYSSSPQLVKNNHTSECTLSSRQRQIVDLVAHGLTYKEIALSLHLSEATIKYHMSLILERLQLKNRSQVIEHMKKNKHD